MKEGGGEILGLINKEPMMREGRCGSRSAQSLQGIAWISTFKTIRVQLGTWVNNHLLNYRERMEKLYELSIIPKDKGSLSVLSREE